MIRLLDIFFSIILIFLSIPLLFLIYLLHIIYIKNSFFFIQERLGMNKKIFKIIKLRTMKTNTVNTATHNLDKTSFTQIGSFLRNTKIDELPQLYNVLKGDMSFVGPRPCLPNQLELIHQRNKFELFKYKPGITGLSQINKIDMSDPIKLSMHDAKMYEKFNLFYYLKYLILTFLGRGIGDRIKNSNIK